MSTKTIAIVGITGNQGGSVATTFLNTPGWTIRGISRDPSKPSAQEWASKGVEIVAGDLDDIDSLKKAFSDVNVIFGTTDFWVHFQNPSVQEQAQKEGRTANELAYDRELQQVKNLVDAVAADTSALDLFVLSTLSDTKKWSKGKITWNYHFDAKAHGVDYLKEKYPALDKKTSLLQLGAFMSNWKQGQAPKKQEDGSYVMMQPMSGTSKIPMVDPNADTGNFVKALTEVSPGKNLVGAGSRASWDEWCALWGKHNGVKASFQQIPRKFLDDMGDFGHEMADMLQYFDEFGYDGSDPSVVNPDDLGVDVKYTTLEDYIKKTDWSSVL
ncbi:hypothetical protein BDV96DRAFT_601973 [Lophiotrema nucula]|uniref:NmrA-like domain-containing protein n=1 Tax=Lophiotrema nucula TaxID=690887 RepID=A0A6A5Z0J1_9PLEO|nr:hypothetical protein BDV96DRAFT_601973 [Lophiotrema nucula]